VTGGWGIPVRVAEEFLKNLNDDYAMSMFFPGFRNSLLTTQAGDASKKEDRNGSDQVD
jgi:hypothetical protein